MAIIPEKRKAGSEVGKEKITKQYSWSQFMVEVLEKGMSIRVLQWRAMGNLWSTLISFCSEGDMYIGVFMGRFGPILAKFKIQPNQIWSVWFCSIFTIFFWNSTQPISFMNDLIRFGPTGYPFKFDLLFS